MGQMDPKSVLFLKDVLCLVPNMQTNAKNWRKRMQRTFHEMLDQFSDSTLPLPEGSAEPKRDSI